jgi:ABC-type multidrug transport system permease subunit
MRAFVIGLAFLGAIVAAQVVFVAAGLDVFLSVDDFVKIATTFGSIIGPPLGFVISYYFKERESRP